MALLPLLRSALTLVGMFWITFRIDATLALVSLTVVPFLYYSVGHYVSRIQPRLRAVREEYELVSSRRPAITAYAWPPWA